jgi:ribosomal protein L37E
MSVLRFQCPECGFGDYEVGYLTDGAEAYCVICLDEAGRRIRLHSWEEAEQPQARFRLADAA